MRFSALADVSKADKKEKMAVDEFFFSSAILIYAVQVPYIVPPMRCFAAVTSSKPCEIASSRLQYGRKFILTGVM